LGGDPADKIYFGFVNMPVRKMLQQIIKGKNIEFFFQQVGPLRTNTF
jgi:hypothetical protein